MRIHRWSIAPLHRLAYAGAALLFATLSCGHDVTAPGTAASREAQGLSFQTVFPAAFQGAGTSAADVVAFSSVRIVLRHADGTVALDTAVTFPAGADSIALNLTVTLESNVPATGEPLALTLAYVNAQGDTVFKGGPVTVDAVPGTQATAPVQVPVIYTGPGATAVAVHISPRTLTLFTGDPFSLSAVAVDASNTTLANTPIVWASLSGGTTITQSGTGTAGPTRGTARILAQLLTGPTDTATLIIQPRPTGITALSGSGQSGTVGSTLSQSIVAHVSASDGGGVSGLTVSFVAANGGSVGNATVVTDSSGNASTTWTLGSIAGAQTLVASAVGFNVTFNATATALPATQLAFTTSPTSTAAGAPFAVTVSAEDANGHVATGFTGAITLALGANPGNATFAGTTTVNAVAGVATFTGLTLNKPATGYTLTASATSLTTITSGALTVSLGTAATCTLISGGSQSGAGGSALTPISVLVADAASNPVPGVTLAATVTTGGGAATPSAVTNALGLASFNWTLGAVAGTQTLTINCPNSTPIVVSATATSAVAGPATHLVFAVQPHNAVAGVANSPAIVVQALDANGLLATSFTGTVFLGTGNNPGDTGLGGTTSMAAVGGVATFSNITISVVDPGYTLIASSSPLTNATSSPFNITAATGGITWTGATSTAWTTASNWNPAVVPAGTDSVTIPLTTNQPVVSTVVLVKALVVSAGAAITNNDTIKFAKSLDAGTNGIIGSGGIIPIGVSTLKGSITNSLVVTNSLSLFGSGNTVTINGNVILTSGQLTVNGNKLIVSGALTVNTGSLAMTNAADSVGVSGSVTFNGSNENGFLTAGTLAVGGNFVSSAAAAFIASSTHLTYFNGANPQSVSFVNGSMFENVTFANGSVGGVTMLTNIQAQGNVGVTTGSVNGVGFGATISGTLTDPAGNFRPAAISFANSSTPVSATTPAITSSVTFNKNPTMLAADLTINGAAFATGNLQLNGRYLIVNGNFATSGFGQLTMVNVADSLLVTGTATFAGGGTQGIMTNGTLILAGNLVQTLGNGSGGELNASAPHVTVLTGSAAQTITFATPDSSTGPTCNMGCLGNLTINKTSGTVTFNSPAHMLGALHINAGATSVQAVGTAGNVRLLQIRDSVVTAATVPVHFSRMGTKGNIALGALTVVDSIGFSGNASQIVPAGTYGLMAIYGSPTLAGNIVTTSHFLVDSMAQFNAGGKVITVGGNFITADGGAMSMNSGDSIVVAGSAFFDGGTSHMNGGVLQIVGSFSQGVTTQSFEGTGNHITRFVGPSPTITFANPTTSMFSRLEIASAAGSNYVFNSDVLLSGSVWLKTGGVTGLTNGGHTFTIQGGIYDTTGGRWQVTNTVMTGVNPILPRTLNTNMTLTASTQLFDSLKFTGVANTLTVSGSGALIMAGHYVRVPSTFSTTGSGTLTMNNPHDTLIIKGNASFNGGSTTGLLTNGYLEFDGASFVQGTNATAFAADNPHQTYFWGSTQQTISFANPGFPGNSHFGNLYLADTATVLGTSIFLDGELQTGNQSSFHVEATADRLVTSNGADLRNIVFDNVRWKTTGTNGNGLFPSLDNVIFQNISATTLPQFDFEYSTITNLNLPGFTFSTPPTGGGSYIKVVGPDTLTMSSVSPTTNGGFLSLSGFGAVNGWSSVTTWVGSVSTDWSTAGNWNSGVVPTTATDVMIPNGTSFAPATSVNSSAHNLTIGSTVVLSLVGANASINVSGDLTVTSGGRIDIPTATAAVIVNGNVIADTAGVGAVTTCAGGQGINLQTGTGHTVQGKFCNLFVDGSYTASGPIVTVGSGSTGYVQVPLTAANLTLNGHRVDAGQLWIIPGGGTITMNNSADTLVVHNGGLASFQGGASQMTAGTLVIRSQNFNITGAGIDASGTHTTVLDTSFTQSVAVTSPVAGHGLNNLTFRNIGGKSFQGDQTIRGNVTLASSMNTAVTGSYDIAVGGNIIDSTAISGGGWQGSTLVRLTGTPTILPTNFPVNTIWFTGGSTVSLSNNLSTNYVIVDSNTTLKLNGHLLTTHGNSFTTQNSGTLQMSTSADSLDLGGGTALFNGGSTAGLLTNGGFAFGSLLQGYSGVGSPAPSASASSFSPNAGLRSHVSTSGGGNILFLNPGTGSSFSHFWLLQTSTSSSVFLKTNIYVDSLLLGEFSGASLSSDSIPEGVVRTVITKGVYNSGTFALTLSGVNVVLNDGPGGAFFENVTWNSFPSNYTGVLFTQNLNATMPPVLNFLTYSGITFGTGGQFVSNTGTENLTLGLGITPAICASSVLTLGLSCH